MNAAFKALDDPTRRKILEMLRKKDLTAGEIADAFHITKPSISHHLDILRQADMVVAIKEGQFIRYSLNTTVFDGIMKWIFDFTDNKPKKTKK
jgi:DNA-binding transcriptional ArsR family regulator